MYSRFLDTRKEKAKELLNELLKEFKYVSILGTDCKSKVLSVLKSGTDSREGMGNESGFVVKATNNHAFFEYSFDDFNKPVNELKDEIISSFKLSEKLSDKEINSVEIEDEPLVKEFSRDDDYNNFSQEERLITLNNIKNELLSKSDKILNGGVSFSTLEINKLFLSRNRDLFEHYTWTNGTIFVVYRNNDKVVQARETAFSNLIGDVLKELPTLIDKLLDKAEHLTKATKVKPGVYDIITDPSITGLIAHEAFGHGVEMDQFVKDRALAKNCMNEYVASPITTLKDGANSGFSTASYFFDDDGVLAHDTTIIDKGVLVSGICDLTSSRELNVKPTGNSRRETYKRKVYTRMTNTFIEAGNDKLEDMIKSIKHGYFLFETNNGMEDPKNWAIQCTAEYGIEIVDGKLTDNYVSPVVMSGYVPDLLKSISMISDKSNFVLEGAGSCGKGYKEWVRVSTGGSNLKARVKLS